MKEVNRIIEMLKNIYGKVGIIFHCDADGACSAAQILKYLRSKGIATRLASGELEKTTFMKIKEHTELCLILDIPVDQHSSYLNFVKSEVIAIIDHHPPFKNLNEIGTVHINPRFYNFEKYVSASEVVYGICKKLGVKDILWIKRIGAVGDRSIKGTKKEILAAEYIDAVKSVKGDNALKEAVEKLSKCKNIEEFLKIKEYAKLAEKVNEEVRTWVEKAGKRSGSKDIIILEVESPYSITSRVANEIFDKYPKSTVIVYSFKDGFFKISGRSRNYDIGRIFFKSSQGIGRGGGHSVAAGARIEGDKINIFIQRLKKFLKNKI